MKVDESRKYIEKEMVDIAIVAITKAVPAMLNSDIVALAEQITASDLVSLSANGVEIHMEDPKPAPDGSILDMNVPLIAL